jgi:Ubiquitin-binding domain
MGCCVSTNRRSGESYGHELGSSTSVRNIAVQQNGSMQLQDRFNRPLCRHVWASRPPITFTELRRRREEYFDTRVTGRSECWNAIGMAVEVIDEDLGTAQEILNAAGISVPTGLFCLGVCSFHPASAELK